MNPESTYPELKDLKSDELFIEVAYVSKSKEEDIKHPLSEVYKVPIRKIILKKNYNIFTRELKQLHSAGFVTLVTITKK